MTEADAVQPSATLSVWRPLLNKPFRNLLIADFTSDVGSFLQSVGAAWLMTSLTHSPLYIALIQTAAALPFFLLALPAGAIGDIVDRRKLILLTEVWMCGIAAVLAIATLAGAMTPWLLLLLTLALSAGDAVEAPAWRATLPDLVDKEALPAALVLNGVEFNLARAVGPGLAGLIVSAVGVGAAFIANTFSFFGVILVVARWKHRPRLKSAVPVENFLGGITAAIRYVRYSPGIRTLLARSAILIFFTSSFWALLPTAARKLSGSPVIYGFLLGCFGAGAVLGAVILPRARARFAIESIVSIATAVFSGVLLSMAFLHRAGLLGALMLFGGAAWTIFMSVFNVVVQKLAPAWVRSRVLAFYLFVFQGSVAAGSTLWGIVATHTSLHQALAIAGLGTATCLLLQPVFPLPSTSVDLSAWNHWLRPTMFQEPDPDEGPVLITVKYVIDPAKAHDFLHHMYRYERIRRRDGATEWGVFADTESPDVYLETFLVDSWAEHERQHERFTRADREAEQRVQSFARKPIEVKHYVHAPRS